VIMSGSEDSGMRRRSATALRFLASTSESAPPRSRPTTCTVDWFMTPNSFTLTFLRST
jgi:hypothetical protein